MKGLYVHLPFCKNKCGYCGFYSDTESFSLQQDYFRAMIADLKSRKRRDYDSLYIGGGTPSSVDRKMLAAFMDIVSVLHAGVYKESTIEANPESIDEEFCEMVHDYKFTRISIGCQSTSDEVLSKLTRIHTAQDIFDKYEMVRRLCPNVSINMDMMFDIPEVDFQHTYQTLKDFIKLSPDHISAYTYSHDRDFLPKLDDNTTDFMLVRDTLEGAGYIKYEISNFAKAGHESIHNINYWQLGEYDGIGASAWTLENRDNQRILSGNTDNIKDYIADPVSFLEVETTQPPTSIIEQIVFGLRIINGVNIPDITKNLDAETKQKLYNLLIKLKQEELLSWDGSVAALTKTGELLLDSVQSLFWELLP